MNSLAEVAVKATILERCIGNVISCEPDAMQLSYASVAHELLRMQRSSLCDMLESAYELLESAADMPLDTLACTVDDKLLAQQLVRNVKFARRIVAMQDTPHFNANPLLCVLCCTDDALQSYLSTDIRLEGMTHLAPEEQGTQVDLYASERPEPRPTEEASVPVAGNVFLAISNLVLELSQEARHTPEVHFPAETVI